MATTCTVEVSTIIVGTKGSSNSLKQFLKLIHTLCQTLTLYPMYPHSLETIWLEYENYTILTMPRIVLYCLGWTWVGIAIPVASSLLTLRSKLHYWDNH